MRFVLVLLLLVAAVSASRWNRYRRYRRVNRVVEWWRGPNVCRTEDVTVDDVSGVIRHRFVSEYQTCDLTDTYAKYTNVEIYNGRQRTCVTTYQCCSGFERLGRTSGCRKEVPMTDLVGILQELELTDLVEAIEDENLTETLDNNKLTVFAPVDGSFDLVEGDAIAGEEDLDTDVVYIEDADAQGAAAEVLQAHIVEGTLMSHELDDEQLLTSLAGSSIRINKYSTPKQITTANCVPVKSVDNLATNGVAHVVTSRLPDASSSIYEIVATDPSFSTLKTVLDVTGLGRALRNGGSFTVFAPTDEAFASLGSLTLDRLLQNTDCLANVLRNHVVDCVTCSATISSRTQRVRTLQDTMLGLTRHSYGVFVNDAEVLSADVMASNGVIHVIDKVLISEEALSVVDVLRENHFTEMLSLLERADLTDVIASTSNVTILVPSTSALARVPPEIADDFAQLREVLSYHVIAERKEDKCDLEQGQFDTFAPNKPINFKTYISRPFGFKRCSTAQCQKMRITQTIQSCNAVVHVIDTVLLPPTGSVANVIRTTPELSTLFSLLRLTGLDAELMKTDASFTVFAPSNAAFAEVDPVTLQSLQEDTDALREVLQRHVVADLICCSALDSSRSCCPTARLRSLDAGSALMMRRFGDVIYAGDARIDSCDNAATNGVVHVIDQVLLG